MITQRAMQNSYFTAAALEQLRYAEKCKRIIKTLSRCLECDESLIEETARNIAKTTDKTYEQAIYEAGARLKESRK